MNVAIHVCKVMLILLSTKNSTLNSAVVGICAVPAWRGVAWRLQAWRGVARVLQVAGHNQGP